MEAAHFSAPSVNFNILHGVTEDRTRRSYRHQNLIFQIIVLFITKKKNSWLDIPDNGWQWRPIGL
jgi:hypothetical protein